MIKERQLKVGERVYDVDNQVWVNILSFANGESILDDKDGESIVVVDNQEFDEAYEVHSAALYKVAENVFFKGHIVCYEHFESIDYPYFCPDLDENFYSIEVTEK